MLFWGFGYSSFFQEYRVFFSERSKYLKKSFRRITTKFTKIPKSQNRRTLQKRRTTKLFAKICIFVIRSFCEFENELETRNFGSEKLRIQAFWWLFYNFLTIHTVIEMIDLSFTGDNIAPGHFPKMLKSSHHDKTSHHQYFAHKIQNAKNVARRNPFFF